MTHDITEHDQIQATGKLDRAISEMMVWAEFSHLTDLAAKQTLKHHAKDMVAAGKHILAKLSGVREYGDCAPSKNAEWPVEQKS